MLTNIAKKVKNKFDSFKRNHLNRLRNKLPNRRSFEFLWQRIYRGFDDSETWSLDITVAEFMLPRLKRFREITVCRPGNLTDQQWNDILDEIEWYLTQIVEFNFDYDEERMKIAQILFTEYFRALWF